MKNAIQTVFRFIKIFSEINTWRKILTGTVKIRVYLKGGHHMDIIVTKWTATKTGGVFTSWSAEGLMKNFDLDPSEIVAWREK